MGQEKQKMDSRMTEIKKVKKLKSAIRRVIRNSNLMNHAGFCAVYRNEDYGKNPECTCFFNGLDKSVMELKKQYQFLKENKK